jgi:hypothetical protein
VPGRSDGGSYYFASRLDKRALRATRGAHAPESLSPLLPPSHARAIGTFAGCDDDPLPGDGARLLLAASSGRLTFPLTREVDHGLEHDLIVPSSAPAIRGKEVLACPPSCQDQRVRLTRSQVRQAPGNAAVYVQAMCQTELVRGSGIAVSPIMVMTNAHVLRGKLPRDTQRGTRLRLRGCAPG